MEDGTTPFGAVGLGQLEGAADVVDRQLAGLAPQTDLLLALTPVDVEAAWERFRAHRFEQEPEFHYRPLAVDPGTVRRALHELPVANVDDPTLSDLFREKQNELDAELDLLVRRGGPGFLEASTVLYGTAPPSLVALAHRVLRLANEHRAEAPEPTERPVDAAAFAALAREEIAGFRTAHPDLIVAVETRDDVSGVMVDHGRLLIDARLQIDEIRADALIQHEVGTHVLTWVNGDQQPLRLLRVGLPHYDEAQEALAVVAEFVTGGLTSGRMATLAARVLAVDCLCSGAGFVETFRSLTHEAGITPTAAFDVAMRVHRGGGFTKDVIYLRGLERLLAHLGASGSLDDLLVGKLALEHLPVVEELRRRHVLVAPTLRPRWLRWPGGDARLAALRDGLDVEDLLNGGAP